MGRLARRMAGFRPTSEIFRGVRWNRKNRLWHEANKRMDPRFSAACKLNWSRILKQPDTRFKDGRQLAIAARDIGLRRVAHFVAYEKRHGILYVISIRYADTEEKHLFFRHYP